MADCRIYTSEILGEIIAKDIRSKTIFVTAKIVILYEKISIFTFTKILFERRYLEMIAHKELF